jgi:hypothetical protein
MPARWRHGVGAVAYVIETFWPSPWIAQLRVTSRH